MNEPAPALAALADRSPVAAVPASVHRAADLWWLHPARIVLLGVLPVYLSTMFFDMRRVVANVYLPGWEFAFGALLIVALATGAQAALMHAGDTRAPRAPPQISTGVMMLLWLPMLLAYAVWFGPLLVQPQLLLEIVRGERAELRDSLSTVKGLTTFTQFGVVYVIAHAIKFGAGVQRVSRLEHLALASVLLLAVFRAFVWAERLAVLELLVCWTLTSLAYLRLSDPRWLRAARLAPAVAPLLLYLVFTASEYFRSWEYYTNQYDSVWAFTFDRLLAYYATAVNNGIGALVETTGWPHFSGAFIVESLYRMPGLGSLLSAVLDDARDVPQRWIEVYARPEFNSQTDYFRIVLDLGWFGALVYYLVLGWLIGRAYHGFRNGGRFGLLLYGLFVLHLIESLRYGYLGESRFIPTALGLLLLALDMRRPSRAALTSGWSVPGSSSTSR